MFLGFRAFSAPIQPFPVFNTWHSFLSSILSIASVFIFCLHTLAWFLFLGPTTEWNKRDKRARQEIHETLGGVQDTFPGYQQILSACTLCNPMDRTPPGSSVHGILQARRLEWVAISFSKKSIGLTKVFLQVFIQCYWKTQKNFFANPILQRHKF